MSCNCQEIAKKGKQKVEESLAMQLVRNYGKQAKKWFIAWLITFIAFLGILGGITYIIATSEIEASNIEVTQTSDGINTYIGHDGDVNYEPKD